MKKLTFIYDTKRHIVGTFGKKTNLYDKNKKRLCVGDLVLVETKCITFLSIVYEEDNITSIFGVGHFFLNDAFKNGISIVKRLKPLQGVFVYKPLDDDYYHFEVKELLLLTDKERDYLSGVIKPFKNEVKFITYCGEEVIIKMKKNKNLLLPCFKPNTYFKNLELDKDYTLEELDL